MRKNPSIYIIKSKEKVLRKKSSEKNTQKNARFYIIKRVVDSVFQQSWPTIR